MSEKQSETTLTKETDNQYRRSFFTPVKGEEEWRQTLSGLPNPHPLQSWQWGQFKARWGWTATPLILDIKEGSGTNSPLAAMMLLKRKVPRLPFSILYVPKGPLLDYKDAALRRVVLAQLEQIVRREKAIMVKIDPDVVRAWGAEATQRSPVAARFLEELSARGWRFSTEQVQFRNTVLLDLEKPLDDILGAMKQKTRYNIRLAGRRGVTVRPGGSADFPVIVEMYMETAARDGFAVRPIDYYLDIWGAFYEAGMAQPLIAEYEGRALAAVIIVGYGDRATYMYGASNGDERQRMPNYLIQWEAIRWARQAGYKVYDFWGAPDTFDEQDALWGVWRFKAGFNGQVVHHIGAWDYPARPFWYWIYTSLLPRYLALLRSRSGAPNFAS